MATAGEEPMSVYLDRLRTILAALDVTSGECQEDLRDQAKLFADVWLARERLDARVATARVDTPAGKSR